MINKKLAMMMPIMMALDGTGYSDYNEKPLTPEQKEEARKRALRIMKEKQNKIKIKKGMSAYDFNGEIIWARNEKNAMRKAKNKGLI